ncbi:MULTISPECIES: type II toxin-antitoxin system PemK/MazF family toxin [unclassified Corynebacterium]|uniref:type II toxin-antitoxin system PemK/MazF family toxin n=1 Tax=unclassified Corynebacterium TaxID=2624378 RepID=UPI00309872E5
MTSLNDESATTSSPSPKGKSRGFRARLAEWFQGNDSLDEALSILNEQLGLVPEPAEVDDKDHEPVTIARPSAELARSILYSPDMDGQTESGEVVRVHVQIDGDHQPIHERSAVVLGRDRHALLGALISTREEHANDPKWLFIGTGAWDPQGRPSWVRIDRILIIPESGIRRSGTFMPRRRFDRIASRLRSDYHWS